MQDANRFRVGCRLLILLLIGVFPRCSSKIPQQPENMRLTFRSGQTFITWKERSDLKNERYRIYRHREPIRPDNLEDAQLLYEVPEGSARFCCDRYKDGSLRQWKKRYLDHYIIDDNQKQIEDGTGLLVWTLQKDDFPDPRTTLFYYAVTTVDETGLENTSELSEGNMQGPVRESVDDPAPVMFSDSDDPTFCGYIQFMDLSNWNPTFHAPRADNEFYGLDLSCIQTAKTIQYAYTYVVFKPSHPDKEADVCLPAPVVVYLHGHNKCAYPPLTERPHIFPQAYLLYPTDFGETWYFGFAERNDYRISEIPVEEDRIVNYTEQRIIRMIRDLQHNPPGIPVDPERVYIYGHSMGGSGVVAFALRYPGLFAAAYACQPMTNYQTNGMAGGVDWIPDITKKWGLMNRHFPVVISDRSREKTYLSEFNGMDIWECQNHCAYLEKYLDRDIVPLGITHGINDHIIEWRTQGMPAYPALNKSRQCWSGSITLSDHRWMNFHGLSQGLSPNPEEPFSNCKVVKSETIPGFSTDDPVALQLSDTPQQYFLDIQWSSSWNPWDVRPVDESNRWEMSFRLAASESFLDRKNEIDQTRVNITPRRLQKFRIILGRDYHWTNKDLETLEIIQQGKIVADEDGLLNVENFRVTRKGNRLSIFP